MTFRRKPLILAALWVALAAASPVESGPPSDLPQAVEALHARMADLIAQDAPPPLLRDAADAALLNAATDRDAVRNAPLTFLTLMPLCRRISEVQMQFITYAAAHSADRVARYTANEWPASRVMAASNLCLKRSVHAASAFVETLQSGRRPRARWDGVARLMWVLRMNMDGMLLTSLQPFASAQSKELIFDSLAEDIDAVAEAATPADRAAFRTEFLRYQDRVDPAYRPAVKRLASAFERSDCGTLCKFASGTD